MSNTSVKKQNKSQLSLYVSDEVRVWAQKKAMSEGRTVSNFITHLIEAFMKGDMYV